MTSILDSGNLDKPLMRYKKNSVGRFVGESITYCFGCAKNGMKSALRLLASTAKISVLIFFSSLSAGPKIVLFIQIFEQMCLHKISNH